MSDTTTPATALDYAPPAGRSLFWIAFAIVAGVLGVAAVGLNSAVTAMGVHFKKQPVPLRLPLESIPSRLGPWLQVSVDQPLPVDVAHTLGTDDYLNRWYVDTRQLPESLVRDLTSQNSQVRETARAQVGRYERALMKLHMAYYTGMVDTVAHVPERCMVAGGFDPVNPDTALLNVWAPPREPTLPVKYIEFQERANQATSRHNVAYFFQVNGQYTSDALTGVRQVLQDLRQRYGYYCKIELASRHGTDSQAAKDAMADFLRHLMPEAERVLPDWDAVTTGDPNKTPAERMAARK